MTCRLTTRRFAVCAVVVLALATAAGVDAARVDGPDRPSDGGSTDEVLVVDADGNADYASVQAAVDAAGPGDTVRVRPGTYRETVTLDENVTLVAPRGATLDGSGLGEDADGIAVDGAAAPVVDGFTVVGYQVGVHASTASGDWVLRNATVRNASFIGVYASGTAGDWRLRNVTVRDTDRGDAISASGTTGDWRLTDVAVRNVTRGLGIDASPSTGDWTLGNVTVADVDFVGVAASYSGGDWTVANSTVRDTAVGIGAIDASGDWTVRRSVLANVSASERFDFRRPPLEEGVGVYAAGTNGSWTVRGSRFVDNEVSDIAAPDADPAGDAARNYWGGANGADGDDCTGNVDCSDPLADWPPESALAPASQTATIDEPATPATAAGSATGDDGSVTDGSGSGTDAASPTDERPETTADAGPLSPVLAAAALALGGFLAGRRARSRR